MKKTGTVCFFVMTFLLSCVLGALITKSLFQPVMAVNVGKKSKLQLQYRNGTSIEGYGWGEFSEGQTKRLDCQLVYNGEKPIEVTWNTTDFPFGWRIKIRLELEPKRKWWNEDSTIPLFAGETQLIQMVLTEVNGAGGQSEYFTLNFLGLSEKTRNTRQVQP